MTACRKSLAIALAGMVTAGSLKGAAPIRQAPSDGVRTASQACLSLYNTEALSQVLRYLKPHRLRTHPENRQHSLFANTRPPGPDDLHLYLPDNKTLLLEKIGKVVTLVDGRKLPESVLEDVLLVLGELRDPTLIQGATIRFSKWLTLLFVATGLGGLVHIGGGKILAILFPFRWITRWVVTHEIGHIVLDRLAEQNPAAWNRFRSVGWTSYARLRPYDRILIRAYFAVAFGLAAFHTYGMAGNINSSFLVVAGVTLVALALGLVVSGATGGLANLLGGSQTLWIANPRRVLAYSSPYGAVNPDEDGAESFTAAMWFPRALLLKAQSHSSWARQLAVLH
jgi:hypothetical protein